MSGRIIDLSQPNVVIPDPVVVDTNVVVEWAVGSYQNVSAKAARAGSFFQHLVATDQQANLTPTAFSEFLHVAILSHYKHVFRQRGRTALSRQFGINVNDERALFKLYPSILQQYSGSLDLLAQSLAGGNVVILDPDQLGPIRSGRSHHRELLRVVGHYGLDTSDALILMEASRLEVRVIVTIDTDMRRTHADFDILTWL